MLSVTPRAQDKLSSVLKSQGLSEASVRIVAVRGPHGCVHGWRLAIDDVTNREDTIVYAGEVRLLVESELADILEGASIDYREDALGIGFAIEAPNAPAPGHHGGCHHGD